MRFPLTVVVVLLILFIGPIIFLPTRTCAAVAAMARPAVVMVRPPVVVRPMIVAPRPVVVPRPVIIPPPVVLPVPATPYSPCH